MLETIQKRQDQLFTRLEDINNDSKHLIGVHEIAAQFYCEKQIHLKREIGSRESEATIQGKEAHEDAIAHTRAATRDEIWEIIDTSNWATIYEVPFVGGYSDVTIIGRPDAILFYNRKPVLIIERKFGGYRDRWFKNQVIQAWLYAQLLDRAGFETTQLRYTLLKLPQSLGGKPELIQELEEEAVPLAFEDGGTQHRKKPMSFCLDKELDVHSHVWDYYQGSYWSELQWAFEYWRNERGPEPTSKPGKCRACEYLNECSDALI